MRMLLCAMVLSVFCMISIPSKAQFFKKLKDEVSKRVENKVINDAGRASEKGVDKVEKGASDAVAGKNKNSNTSESGKIESTSAAQVSENKQNVTKAEKGIGKTKENYDFKPGERTLFEIDFTKEQEGNFPRRLEFIEGNFEVVEWNGKRYGRAKDGKTQFAIHLPENLPEKFTIQLKLHDASWLDDAMIMTTPKVKNEESYFLIYNRGGVGVYTKEGPSSRGSQKAIEQGVANIEIMMDGTYAKMFVDGVRVANIPNANVQRTNKLYFYIGAREKPEWHVYITDIRIAAGGQTLYQTLESEGRVAFHDIHFATGKADILPESAASIKTVADLLKEHADLYLLIEGHTDNTGDFDKNRSLSKERADAVRTYLIEKFNIEGNRLKTKGNGQTNPVASNDTEEGRAKNRRVEIVKM